MASNGANGAAPNPAGFIAAIRLSYAGGGQKIVNSGASWQATSSTEGPWSAAQELGAAGMKPWNLEIKRTPRYPSYASTANLLQSMGVAPDFASGAPMRSIHRRLPDGEMYFVANASAEPIETVATFRVAGLQPQWWNPISGERRELTDYSSKNGLTNLPVRLAPHESGFVIFRKASAKRGPVKANFPSPQTLLTLSKPWNVSFDPKWGGPANVSFPTLTDWTQSSENGIKFYSGKRSTRPISMRPLRFQAARAPACRWAASKIWRRCDSMGAIWEACGARRGASMFRRAFSKTAATSWKSPSPICGRIA